MTRTLYLDHNATTPVDPRAVEAMLPFLGADFGNPSSGHAYGAGPKAALEQARARIASLLGAEAGRVVLTGSGSEANHLALRGVMLGGDGRGEGTLVTQPTEHPAVLATAAALERFHGTAVQLVPVDGEGLVDPDEVDRRLARISRAGRGGPVLVSVMAANNETGALQPIRDLVRVAHRWGALVHCDAAQAVGKIPVDVAELGVDLLTVVGHKMYAPKGIATLWVRAGLGLEPVSYGGGQEGGLRAGTENVALAVAFGVAAQVAAADLAGGGAQRLTAVRDRLHAGLDRALPGRVRLNGPAERRLPNTLNVGIDGIEGHRLLAVLPGVAASTGSACHSGDTYTPSPVLTAMGQPPARALSAIRFSVGRATTDEEIDEAVTAIAGAVRSPPRRGHDRRPGRRSCREPESGKTTGLA